MSLTASAYLTPWSPRCSAEPDWAGLSDFADALVAEPRRGVLMERIAVAADARYDTISATCTGRRVRTHQGWQAVERRGPRQSREPRATPPAEVLQKFQVTAGDALPCHARDQPAGRLLGLEQQPVVERTHAAARGRARVTGVATGVSRLPKRRASAGRRNKLRSQRRFIGFPWAMGLQNTASPTSRGSTPGMSRRSCGSAPCPGSEAAYSQRRTEAL
jgi:hypothetical protein